MWRLADSGDDAAIIAMCRALNEKDPGPAPVPADHVRRRLAALRAEPARGRAVVFDAGAEPVGYAFLIAFWSNELGGEVCTIDEIYVQPGHRGRGCASELVQQIVDGVMWPVRPVALELEVSPDNARARRLYERLGQNGCSREKDRGRVLG
jgi:GNAT superfamily N-acetyltransferase